MSNTSLNFFKYNISEQEYYFGRIIFNSTSEKSPASAGGEMNRHLCHQPVTIGM